MNPEELKHAVEALLFASESPLSIEEIRTAFDEETVSAEKLRAWLAELKEEYESGRRGFKLVEMAGGFQLVSHPRFAAHLKRFYQSREKRKLSQASLETLSVVAYRQPVTRADIEFVRGVNVDGALKTLLERRLVRTVGRKEVPGRPILYGTTKGFLEYFGLDSVKELPALSEFTEKDIDPALLPPEIKQNNTQ